MSQETPLLNADLDVNHETSISNLLSYLKQVIKDSRTAGGKSKAHDACDRINELYINILEENANLLRRENTHLTTILEIERENSNLKSSTPIALCPPNSISYASAVKGPETYRVILEPKTPLPDNKKSYKKVDVSRITSDLNKVVQNECKDFAVNNAIPGKNGKIFLELSSKDDAERALKVFTEKKDELNFTPKMFNKRLPRMMVHDISEHSNKDVLCSTFMDYNDKIATMKNEGEIFKIVTIFQKRSKEYVAVIEISPKIRKEILNQRGLKLGFMIKKCEDSVHLTRCGKCNFFGHKTSVCHGKEACSFCAGPHDYSACKASRPCCRSCSANGLKNTTHASYEIKKCPSASMILEKLRSYVSYS